MSNLVKKPVDLEHDTSIGHEYMYYAVILNDGVIVSVWPVMWTTLGNAQSFWAYQIDGEYMHTQEGWVGNLKQNIVKYMKGQQVRITNGVVHTG